MLDYQLIKFVFVNDIESGATLTCKAEDAKNCFLKQDTDDNFDWTIISVSSSFSTFS